MGSYNQALDGCRIKIGAPIMKRPSKTDLERFEQDANQHCHDIHQQQLKLIQKLRQESLLNFFKGKHILVAGGTGYGLGGAIVNALLHFCLDETGSICVLSRDLSQSFEFHTGLRFKQIADNLGLSHRFYWSNRGLNLEGKPFDDLIHFYQSCHAKNIIYINTIASASSGLTQGLPPVYVKDIDEDGLFQWKLDVLSDAAIQRTQSIMGEMSVAFIHALKQSQIQCELSVFADWRGSLDKESRSPDSNYYGRQGAYSTSLYLPKDVIQQFVHESYRSMTHRAIDIFYPVMKTRALQFIPGGSLMASVLDNLYARSGFSSVPIWELAIQTLNCIHDNMKMDLYAPFPRLDLNEISVELWFNQIMQHINEDEQSPFFYKNWISPERHI